MKPHLTETYSKNYIDMEQCKTCHGTGKITKFGQDKHTHYRCISCDGTGFASASVNRLVDTETITPVDQSQQSPVKTADVSNFPFFISPAGKHYYCYKDLNGKNQHSNTFDSYDEALEDYSKLYMTKVDQPQQSPVKNLDDLLDCIEKHLNFIGGSNDKWYLQASVKSYLESGIVSGSFRDAIKSIVSESQPVPVTEGREWVKIDPTKKMTIPDIDIWGLTIEKREVVFFPKGVFVPLNFIDHYHPVIPPSPPTH